MKEVVRESASGLECASPRQRFGSRLGSGRWGGVELWGEVSRCVGRGDSVC